MVKYLLANAGDTSSVPGGRKFPWRRKWQPILLLLPGKSHGQKELDGLQFMGLPRV